ncbi:MAG TPA: hypothetical protein VN947_36495 [Polyangia bacterium]|nr:hypothetical protein [Polyangia bacterium]
MMLVRAVAAAVAAALVLGMLVPRADAGAAPAAAAAAAQVHGIALGLFSEDAGWSYRPLLDEIAAAGADHVELVVPWYQTDAAATVIVDHPRFSPTPAAIVAAIRDARAAGLAVTLFPIVRLSAPRTPDEWRGTLAPRDRAAWWRSYSERLVALGRLAAREHVAVLSVGSELSTLDGPADHAAWAAAVAALRRVFHGALMYSGNWDHYRHVAVYDLVDIVGLCAYFALVEPGAPATVDDLTRGWRDMRVELERFFAGRPIVFTELGYRSIHGSSASPWDEGSAGTVDLDEQRRCYAAFRRVWKSAPPDRFGGVYYWNWYGWGGPTSTGYTPRGKPALNELRAFFR